jgi:hypothetical protein
MPPLSVHPEEKAMKSCGRGNRREQYNKLSGKKGGERGGYKEVP